SSWYMSGTGAEMDKRFALPGRVPFAERRGAHFQFQSRSYAVHGFEPVRLGRLRVLVQVDESGCNHKPRRIDLDLTAKLTSRDGSDFLPVNSDIPDSVETRLGIHHPSALEDDVVGLRRKKRRQQPEQDSH